MALNVGTLVAELRLDDSQYNRQTEQAEGRFSKLGGFLASTAKVVGAAAAGGIAAAGAVGIRTAAQMEQAEIGFTTMLGSGERARAFLDDLSGFAAKTPFEFPELQTAASSLVSAGVEADKVIPIMTSLGNATSGMGTGAEGVKRATVALQQMNAAGKITGEDLNQLRDAGIPVYDLLAAATGKSKEEVTELAAKGKLGRQELEQLMGALESGRGLERFTGLMEAQSQSLTGLWSTLKDTFSVGMATAIQPLIPLIKDGLGGAIAFTADIMPKLATGLASIVEHIRSGDFEGLRDKLTGAGDAGGSLTGVLGSLTGLLPDLSTLIGAAADAVGFLADHSDTLVALLPVLVAGFVLYKTAMAAGNVAALASLPIQAGQVLANFALAAAIKSTGAAATTSAMQQVAAGQAVQGSMLKTGAVALASGAKMALAWMIGLGPVALIIAGVVAVGAAIYLLWTKSETFRDIVTGVWDVVKQGIGDAVGIIITQFRFLLEIWLTVADGIVSGAAKALGWIPGLGGKLQEANRAFDDMKAGILGTLDDAANKAFGFGEKAGGNVAAGARGASGQAFNAGQAVANDMGRGFGAGSGQAYNAGVSAGQGLASGIAASRSSAVREAQRTAFETATAMRKGLQVASPSKLTAYYGRMVGEGLAQGIDASLRMVSASADRAALAAVPVPTFTAPAGNRVRGGDGSYAGDAVGTGAARHTDVRIEVNNPVPEPASDSVHKVMRRLSALGVV